MQALRNVPLLVVLIGIGGLVMLVPASHAAVLGEWRLARAFFYSFCLTGVFAVMLGLALQSIRPRRIARSQLISLIGAYLILPALLAVPFHEALRGTTYLNAWFEMVSCFTTTGATVYEDPGRLPPSLHLWRGLVGWVGGLFTWVVAVAVLAPMNLGGFEVRSAQAAGQGASAAGGTRLRAGEAGDRLVSALMGLLPVYGGLTGLLWLLLMLAGGSAMPALVHAMSTLSTSGISATGGLSGGGTGIPGEILVAIFLVFALSRTTFSGFSQGEFGSRLRGDHELRLGLLIVLVVPSFLFLRHFLGATESGEESDLRLVFSALWGSFFTVLSFLSTTGFVAADWAEARGWSGLTTPGTLLVGLAVIGGGVGTTAGGVKLLRVWALYTQAAREMERLVYPNSVAGAGQIARHLRRQGAEIAWIFFMLFAITIAIVSSALALTGLEFENAMVLTVAALSSTGPLAQIGAESAISLPGLGDASKGVMMAAMVLGRLETLAIIALLNPDFWRN